MDISKLFHDETSSPKHCNARSCWFITSTRSRNVFGVFLRDLGIPCNALQCSEMIHVDRKYCNFWMDVTSSFDEMESKKNVHISIALSNVGRRITSNFIAIGADTINAGDNLMTCWFFVPYDFASSHNCAIIILLNFVATRFFSFLEFFDVQSDVVETFPHHVGDHWGGFGRGLRSVDPKFHNHREILLTR